MSREKQIDEMAKDLENHTCMSEFQAEIASQTLYSKGYRKASDVAREIFAEIEEEIRSTVEVILTIKDDEEDGWYDGELNILGILDKYFAELKKKYTEEGK